MKIMIIDDEELLVKGFYKMLDWEEFGMKIVADAANGQEALYKILDLKNHGLALPEVIITDIKMPVMDGIELTRRLQKEYPSIPVLILSNHEDYENVRTAMKCGARDYLLKAGLSPFQLKEYLLKLKEELQAEKEQTSSEKPESKEVLAKAETEEERLLYQNKNIQKVVDYINEHYQEKEVTLSFLANKFYIQKNYLCTIFKQEMNTNLTDYIVQLRMKKAKSLMRTTSLSITEIALRVSYTDLSYFNRLFRKETGLSPREYLNLVRE